MKLPKGFFIFLAVIQAVLTLGHWALYSALVFFFPLATAYHTGLLIALLLWSFSFLAFSIVTFKVDNPFLRMGYILSAVWIPIWFYLLLASLISLILQPLGLHIFVSLIFILALVLSFYGILNARYARITTLRVKLPNLPEIWRGKTAVFVSDLHLGHVLRYGFAGKVIEKINRLKPEIVFIPGDFFDGVETNFNELANLFKSVKSAHGIYYVTGNHEEIAGYKICENAIAQAGMKILENTIVSIQGLQIAGLAYAHESDESVQQLLHNMNIDRSRPTILLKHVPNHIESVAHAGVSLMLSGHSHHGQIWPGRHITKAVWKGYDYGLKKFEQLQVFTSSGVGTWGPPMRVFTKSEIVKIIFE